MSNSALISCTILSPNRTKPRTNAIDRITPHCVVGQCTAEALGNLFANPSRSASSNYGIGYDGRIGMYVEEKDRSWCSSSTANDDRAVTIECASDTYAPWAFKPAVYETLITLCADICRRNGKTKLLWLGDKDKTLSYTPKAGEMVLTVHRWFANKACPGDWLMERMGELADRVTRELSPQPEPWYAEAMAWAEKLGLIKDGRPNDNLTRAEMATILMRYDKIVDAKIFEALNLLQPEDDSFGGIISD